MLDYDNDHHNNSLHHHPESDLLDCFKAFDRNGDNLISRDELQHVMTNLGEQLSPNDITAMMKEADTNGDGFIDFEEFKRLLPE
ncbi:EF-hand [Lichtheimia hyalospora FSU 10163]|nr:EF-hand [Lichtheimia hyalospora FSU 10163]